MKSIKIFGLAALMALLAIVFAGTSSAMAEGTTLCQEDRSSGSNEVCPEGKLVTHIHVVSISRMLILSSLSTVECDWLFLGDLVGMTGNWMWYFGRFTFINCKTSSGTACEVTEVSEGSRIEFLKLGHELADVSVGGEVNTHCGSLINCTYNGLGLSGHGLGPLLSSATNGEFRIEEQTLNRTGGSFCPKTAKLDILVTPLIPTYITE